MSSEKEKRDSVDYLLKLAEINGVAFRSVIDGHVFFFTTKKLAELVEASRKSGLATVFIQNSEQIKKENFN